MKNIILWVFTIVLSIFSLTYPAFALPTATSQSVSVVEDMAATITLRSSGRNPTYKVTTAPEHGTFTTGASANQIFYTPNSDYNGSDSFQFTATDSTGTSTPAIVSLMITAVNDAPNADDVSVSVDASGSVQITLLASDVDGDALTFNVRGTGTPGSGTVSAVSGNLVTYTANPTTLSGTDTFTFDASDGSRSDPGTVTVTINPVPVALSSYLTAAQNTPTLIHLLGTLDGALKNSFTCRMTAAPTQGRIRTTRNSCLLLYTPRRNYFGTDSLSFTVSDGTHTSEDAVFNINVAAPTGLAVNKLQVGVNWVPYGDVAVTDLAAYQSMDAINAIMDYLGSQSVRQISQADLTRSILEINHYDYTNFDIIFADAYAHGLAPIYTWGYYMFTSCTDPIYMANDSVTDGSHFEHGISDNCRAYTENNVNHINEVNISALPTYHELGNEMFHHVANLDDPEDPSDDTTSYDYTFEEQAAYLQFMSDEVSQITSAIRLAPSIIVANDLALNWREGVRSYGFDGDDFDIETIHEYGEWLAFLDNLKNFERTPGKLLYLSETGWTRDPEDTSRQRVSSPEIQAGHVFRILGISASHGVAAFFWHPMVSGSSGTAGSFPEYNLIAEDLTYELVAHAFHNLTEELIPWQQATDLSNTANGTYVFQILTDANQTKYIAWGNGTFTVPAGVTQFASTVPDAVTGAMTWTTTTEGATITLDANIPYLLK